MEMLFLAMALQGFSCQCSKGSKGRGEALLWPYIIGKICFYLLLLLLSLVFKLFVFCVFLLGGFLQEVYIATEVSNPKSPANVVQSRGDGLRLLLLKQ